MTLTLYYAPFACSLVPYVTLTEAKAAFEVVPFNLAKGQQKSADYGKMNPEKKVPLLVVDGKPLSQNVAIQQWIARAYPEAKILPADPWEELQAVSLLAWCAAGIHPHLTRIFAPQRYCDMPGSEESVKRLAQAAVFENFEIAEAKLDGREWFFDHFTAVDAHFFWCYRRAGQFKLDLARFTNCNAHFARMNARASVQKVCAYEAEVQAQFAKAA